MRFSWSLQPRVSIHGAALPIFSLTFPLSSHAISEDGVFWILLDFAVISLVYSFGIGVWVGWDAHVTA